MVASKGPKARAIALWLNSLTQIKNTVSEARQSSFGTDKHLASCTKFVSRRKRYWGLQRDLEAVIYVTFLIKVSDQQLLEPIKVELVMRDELLIVKHPIMNELL